jgi:hypothetical protein
MGLLRHPIWASGGLGHANAPRGLPKYEVTKRLGRVGMRGAPRLGVSVPRGTTIDECMGSTTGSAKGNDDSFGHIGSQRGATPPKDVTIRDGEF